MDKIYSRKRLKLNSRKNIKLTKKKKLILIIIIAIITATFSLQSLNPIFEELCIERAIAIVNNVVKTGKVLEEYEYSDIVTVTKNENEGTSVLKTDVAIINSISSAISDNINDELAKLGRERIQIPLGALFNTKFLSGTGPMINISILPTGNVASEIKTEFEAKGINQSIYRIYLEVSFKVNILTSYKTISKTIVNQVLLVETVILGKVPETYYNLEGVDLENSIDIIE